MKYLFVCFTVLLRMQTLAQDAIMLHSGKEPLAVSKFFLYYSDETHQLGIDEASKINEFAPAKTDVPNYNVSYAAIWGKARFTCNEKQNWYLNLEPPTYTRFDIYQRKKGGPWKMSRSGNAVPVEERVLALNHIIFRLDMEPGDTIDVFFRMYDYYPIHLDLKAGTLESFSPGFHKSDMFNCVCLGILLMMFIYNFYLFITQKQKIYLYYVLYVFFSCMFSIITCGYVFHCPDFIQKLVLFAPTLPPGLFGSFLLLFTLSLFKGLMPSYLKKTMYFFIAVMLLNTIAGAITDLQRFSYIVIQVMGLLLGLTSIWSGIIAYKKGHSSAVYYLLGYSAYLGGIGYLILAGSNVFPMNVIAFRAVLAGSAIEAVMLSFALGDKMKILQKEKEKAQEETFKLIREQNMVLEAKVKERTAEVVAQKELIEEKQRAILDSIRYARRIQASILPTQKYIAKILTGIRSR